MNATSLLTPSENMAFQSFLTSVDYGDSFLSQNEWAPYPPDADMHVDDDSQHAHYASVSSPPMRNEALAKAAKDLMSLDAGSSSSGQDRWAHQQHPHHPHHPPHPAHDLQRSLPQPYQPSLQLPSPHAQSFPAYAKQHEPHAHLRYPQAHQHQQQQQHLPTSIAPLHTVGSSSSGTGSGAHTTPSPYSSPPAEHHPPPLSAPASYHTPAAFRRLSDASQPHAQNPKRALAHDPDGGAPAQPKRHRASMSAAAPPSASTSARVQRPDAPPKPALLSPSQKKANHIQSEQKRRANIRRGYEALCDAVPALREAIAQEEAELERERVAREGEKGSAGAGRGKKRGKKGAAEEGEKVDGRAGPRSENVVLQKTIDYIHELLQDRSNLLTRLNAARSSLPPSAQWAPPEQPLWEREWTGGQGKDDDDEEEDEDE